MKAAVGTVVQSSYEQILQLLKEEQKFKAFELMLQQEDDMLVIRILSKEKSKSLINSFRLPFRTHHT